MALTYFSVCLDPLAHFGIFLCRIGCLIELPLPQIPSSVLLTSSSELVCCFSQVVVIIYIRKVEFDLIKLRHLRLKVVCFHFFEEFFIICYCLFRVTIYNQAISQPTSDLLLLLLSVEPLVNQDYVSIVLDVSDHPSNWLVSRSCCLLAVPLLTGETALMRVEIVLLKDGLGIDGHWVRNPYKNDCSRRIIREVKTFANLSSANSKDHRTFFVNVLVIGWNHELIVRRFTGLLVDPFKSLKFLNDSMLLPDLVKLLKHGVRREED